MKRVKWRTRRPRGSRVWTRLWLIGFISGLLMVILVRGTMHMLDRNPEVKEENGQTGFDLVESSPVQKIPEKTERQSVDRNDKKASQEASKETHEERLSEYDRLWVRVYLAEEKRVEKMPIELYVRGVIAGEMPIDFELEALKAQAIAARTYIYRRLQSADRSDMPSEAQGAEVVNTVQNQVYIPLGALLDRWSGQAKEENLKKLNEAVEQTKGQIITYEGEPIEAAFFSTSNGYTENASDYWEVDLPYLRSVTSPWDKEISPRYQETTAMKLSTFSSKLGVKENAARQMRIIDTTEGRRIKTVAIGKDMFSGREIREKLGLASSQFTWSIKGDEITITTYGYGHGVGMSQWGANGMAQEGQSAEQIVTHYYTGTKVQQAAGLLD
ncbi:stage II sporulation protein D [Paenibacillus solisilvae]|uniref:Stage II sporulation protein D n=1 Tax=Paenibacillus solisilvae TaxID=2486751 RepID=A0ABW0VPA8_9BACL